MQEAAGETVVQSSSISMLLTLAMLLGVSIGFMSLVYLCIKKMAQHTGPSCEVDGAAYAM